VHLVDFGAVQVATESIPALRAERTPKMIRQSDPEQYCLQLSLDGNYGITQAGHNATLSGGDLVLFGSSRPFHGWVAHEDGRCAGVRVHFPRALLPLASRTIDRLLATRLSGREGIGALLSGCLRELAKGTAQYRAADASRLTTIALDLLAALLAYELDVQDSLPPATRRQALLTQIHGFIHQHLSDPHLSPDMIAAAHHISTRHLHRLFQVQDLTVAGWIRQRRLERCHRDLADPHQRCQPIRAIAARWGFIDNPHFSRLFRATYGMSPKSYRQLTTNTRGKQSEIVKARLHRTTS
jgi:AraC-like DNA-binding protein